MVRILTYIYVLIQIGIIYQIHKSKLVNQDALMLIDYLKIGEILIFVPILLILAYRTRQMRAYYMRHIHEDEEADEAAAKSTNKKK